MGARAWRAAASAIRRESMMRDTLGHERYRVWQQPQDTPQSLGVQHPHTIRGTAQQADPGA
jgi:hypothetical protein